MLNRSTVLTDAQVSAVVPALQTQVHRDWAPVWGSDAELSFVGSGQQPEPGAWWIVIADDSDQAGALGYHDLTSEGLPLGKVFARSDTNAGLQWTVTASHELLEMLGDPDINLAAYVFTTATTGRLYAYEVADACEADQYGYQIDGVMVSDFVFPAWFENFRKPGSTQFDFGKHITEPFQLLPGGYIGAFDIGGGSGWHQLTAEESTLAYAARARVGSRRERRRTPREQWLLSDPR
ncbi:hypothetical protein VMT65_28465 [Nocardia sp. CDC153]|uniref:hypothetical protein n=1 Tax=Nocardia sp. CDC153 TaxID=3112167 RepID=UPI002DB67FED|nr:hypothetical protein [Nocardia sp. CDC153]MEC3957002.1 hypothetical protein [Nocardia sp. CDC153]